VARGLVGDPLYSSPNGPAAGQCNFFAARAITEAGATVPFNAQNPGTVGMIAKKLHDAQGSSRSEMVEVSVPQGRLDLLKPGDLGLVLHGGEHAFIVGNKTMFRGKPDLEAIYAGSHVGAKVGKLTPATKAFGWPDKVFRRKTGCP
jgi:hypothetical protein